MDPILRTKDMTIRSPASKKKRAGPRPWFWWITIVRLSKYLPFSRATEMLGMKERKTTMVPPRARRTTKSYQDRESNSPTTVPKPKHPRETHKLYPRTPQRAATRKMASPKPKSRVKRISDKRPTSDPTKRRLRRGKKPR